ncbi:MAG: hypothetical protein P1V97_20835, partial [Planctomycetota bacterium]|nr:hypothetical protein [Planctomycetota bacterium]
VTLINVGGSAVIWMLVTFFTRPTDSAVLQRFYKSVRPLGFWKPVAEESKDTAPIPFPWRAIFCWLIVVASIYSTLFSVRGLISGQYFASAVLFCLTLPAMTWVLLQIPKLLAVNPTLKEEP